MRTLLSFLVLATLAAPAAPAVAQTLETNIQVQDFKIVRSTIRAGEHPRTDIRMRFCNDGVNITNVTGAGQPIRITTDVPHGIPNMAPVRVLYVEGNTAANGSTFRARRVLLPDFTISPNQFDLVTAGGSAITGNGDYTGGGEAYSQTNSIPERARYGCAPSATGAADRALVKDFVLKLPPGLIGNPTAVPQCPTHLWFADACPDNTQLGHVFAEPISGSTGAFISVPTNVFNLQTMGLEPARLGTQVVPGFPPGPLPNTVTIRTTGDYGIDSSQINIPKELGAAAGTVRNIHIVLCERVPCRESDRFQPPSVEPIEPARPFFVNPTSCPTGTPLGQTILSATAGEVTPPGQTTPQPVDVVLTMSGNHGLTDGAIIEIEGATGTQQSLNGFWNVTIPSSDTLKLVRSAGKTTAAGVAGDFSAATVTRPRRARLEAVSWNPGDPGDAMEAPVETTGCDQVPFDPSVAVSPTDASPGASDRQTVSIDYPRSDQVVRNPEQQYINSGDPEVGGGTYTLTFDGQTTAGIAFNARAPAIQLALEALSNIEPGDIAVSGGHLFGNLGAPVKIRFLGAGGAAAPLITVDASGLTGANPPYPAPSVTKGLVWGCPPLPQEPGCTYDWDEVWQASLKDADVTLPPGMGLAPGGGEGLQECTFDEFGVDPSTGRQENNDPAECPEGSHVGDIEVASPALPTVIKNGEAVSIEGKAFFGPTGAPGRPTVANPWKLFLLLEGHGLRIKLVGDVSLSENGQVRTIFRNQPEVPFGHFRLKMGNAKRAVLLTPLECGPHSGEADLTGYNGKPSVSNPTVAPAGCDPSTFSVNIDEASANPEQAGAHSVSHILISRTDASDMLSGLKLSLPPGAAGSLSGVPKCAVAQAQAGTCPESTLVGNIKTSLGSSASLFTVPGKLYLAEPTRPGDVASIVATVPAKAGVPDPQTGEYPIDLGPDVVIINRLLLREADTGVDVILDGAYRGGQRISDGIPTILEGVPLPIRKIEITVDREGFFLNPTGCDPRPVTGTFTSASGKTATSSYTTQAKGCETLPFDPTLYMIVGEAGKTRAGQDVHPPLTAIVTQKAGEAAISRARVLVPDIVRPNVPFLNEPGALCNDAQAQARTCPPKSLVGSARVITPVLPFELNGPVHIVQEIGNILPKLYVYLRGGGFEVLLKARNRITGVRTENTFDFVPDVPQSYFELKIKGGEDGLLNNFFDLCKTPADSKSRQVEATFNGHNGAVKTSKFPVRVEGCGSSLAAARISSARIKVNRKGIAKVKVSCRRKDGACRGRLAVSAKGISAAKSFSIAKRKSRTLKLKFSKSEVRRLRKARRKQMKGRATTKVGSSSTRRTVTLVFKRR